MVWGHFQSVKFIFAHISCLIGKCQGKTELVGCHVTKPAELMLSHRFNFFLERKNSSVINSSFPTTNKYESIRKTGCFLRIRHICLAVAHLLNCTLCYLSVKYLLIRNLKLCCTRGFLFYLWCFLLNASYFDILYFICNGDNTRAISVLGLISAMIVNKFLHQLEMPILPYIHHNIVETNIR